MSKRVIGTNSHIDTKEKRIRKVAKSQSDSHRIEGIDIAQRKIKEMLRGTQ